MKLTHRQTLVAPTLAPDPFQLKITALCFSPNGERLAVVTADRIVSIYDSKGAKVDKFSTKPNEKSSKDYLVRSMHFGPDVANPKLAMAQSDAIVFIYKWAVSPESNLSEGDNPWNGKKSICNKFPEACPVTSLVWPTKHPLEVVYGLSDGKVKIGYLRPNKTQTLFKGDTQVVSLASHPNWDGVLAAHDDGSIHRFLFPSSIRGPSCTKIVQHSCPAYALSWGESICAARHDQTVVFYDVDGVEECSFVYERDRPSGNEIQPGYRDFTAAAFNPAGNSIVVGSFNCFHTYSRNTNTNMWQEGTTEVVENMYSITAMAWTPNGASLMLGTSCGVVDWYDACFRRFTHKNIFEVTYVSPSHVLIRNKDVANATPLLLRSKNSENILKISFYPDPETNMDSFVVARTKKSLLICNMESTNSCLTEIAWTSNDLVNESFLFDSPHACMISRAGELSIVEFGSTTVLGLVRTEYTLSHLLSLRINEHLRREHDTDTVITDNKKIAYLLDKQTICVTDLVSMGVTTLNHSCPIDFLELNSRAKLVLFRDKKRVLHLFDCSHLQTRTTLLADCSYVQWVPGSDVVVAQSRTTMCVWYNIKAPDQITTREIDGEIEGIERAAGKTEVLVDETTRVLTYLLVEELIEFETAVEDKDFLRAIDILETMEMSPQAEAMWQQLHDDSLQDWDLYVAERCAAAIGNVSRARYLRRMSKLAKISKEAGVHITDNWQLKAAMCQLKKELGRSEDVYIDHGKFESAIAMYEELLMFADAIRVAEKKKHPEVESKRRKYFEWLIQTKQDEKAALIKEKDGDYAHSISLYMSASLPGRAAHVISKHNVVQPSNLLDSVAESLKAEGMHDKAGDVYERMSHPRKAMECFLQGCAFGDAVELARKHFPSQVVALEEKWGDDLVTSAQFESSIDHYMEAHVLGKAIGSAIRANKWITAANIADQAEGDATVLPYYEKLARYFESHNNYHDAQRFFVKAEMPHDAVDMYVRKGLWDQAHEAATRLLSVQDVSDIYDKHARILKSKEKLQDAEKLFLAAEKYDDTIAMYKERHMFDKVIELVTTYRPDVLKDTHQFVAKHLESSGNLKLAEKNFVSAGDWLGAVNMYCSNDMWDDALRVSKMLGGDEVHTRTAYAYALHLGLSMGSKTLKKLGLLEKVIEYAMACGAFTNAFEMKSEGAASIDSKEIHLKYAMFLEDEGRFSEAEKEFINAERPNEAVDMYLHNKSWDEAAQVSRQFCPTSLSNILIAHAQAQIKQNNFARAEELFIEAGKPDLALDMYKQQRRQEDAKRVAKHHLLYETSLTSTQFQKQIVVMGGATAEYASRAYAFEKLNQFDNAIDAYLLPSIETAGTISDLEKIWENAIRLARRHCPDRVKSVGQNVASRLCKLKRYERAADILFELDAVEESVNVAMSGMLWDKAREFAQSRTDLSRRVDTAYTRFMEQQEDTSQLLRTGHTKAALDIMAKQGNWDAFWDTVSMQKDVPDDILVEYAVVRLTDLLGRGRAVDLVEAVTILIKPVLPLPDYHKHEKLYRRLVSGILSLNDKEEDEVKDTDVLSSLKGIMYKSASKLRKNANGPTGAFIHLLMAVHYSHMLRLCVGHGLLDLAAKCAVTLLRYSVMSDEVGEAETIIPADKAFYNAGNRCREAKHVRLAFIMLNHYVDLVEAIEDNDSSNLTHDDFKSTLIPVDITIPPNQYITDEGTREGVRQWVLSACMESNMERALPSQELEGNEGSIYAGLYPSDYPQCIISGYPVKHSDVMMRDTYKANRKDWNSFVQKTGKCPWTSDKAQPNW